MVFENCDRLIGDQDPYVQKSVGWLLKVTSVHHQATVLQYLRENQTSMQRSTIRYALEKIDKQTRGSIMDA